MNRPTKIMATGILLGCFLSSAWLVSAQTPSLISILAPINDWQDKKVDEQPVKEVTKVVEKEVVEKVETVSIELNAVLRKLEEQVSTSLEEGSDLTLKSTVTWKPVTVEKGSEWYLNLKNNFFPDTNGRWYASFDIISGDETVASKNLRVDATLYKEVWLTKRRFDRGDSPSEPGIQPILRDVFLERGAPVPVTANLSEYELIRAVPEGHLLNWHDMKVRPSVRRGNLVEVIVHQGPMTVTMRGRSLDDGLKGDNVTVRNLTSNRDLIGKVVGVDRVQFIP